MRIAAVLAGFALMVAVPVSGPRTAAGGVPSGPTIVITPAVGPPGTLVEVQAKNFCPTCGALHVHFGGVPITDLPAPAADGTVTGAFLVPGDARATQNVVIAAQTSPQGQRLTGLAVFGVTPSEPPPGVAVEEDEPEGPPSGPTTSVAGQPTTTSAATTSTTAPRSTTTVTDREQAAPPATPRRRGPLGLTGFEALRAIAIGMFAVSLGGLLLLVQRRLGYSTATEAGSHISAEGRRLLGAGDSVEHQPLSLRLLLLVGSVALAAVVWAGARVVAALLR